MSILKKFAAPLVAVALVAVMGVSLLGTTRTAHAAVGTGTVAGGAVTVAGGIVSSTASLFATGILSANITVTEIGTWATNDTIVLTHTGYTLSGITSTVTAGTTVSYTYAAGQTTIDITLGDANAADDVITITGLRVASTGVSDGTTIAAIAAAGQAIPFTNATTAKRMILGWSSSTSAANPFSLTAPNVDADTTSAGGAICAYVGTSAGAVAVGLPVTFTVSLGVLSTGSAKTSVGITSTSGTSCTNYRGSGGVASTDTAIVSNSSVNQVATLSIPLVAPSGTTASKLIIQQPNNLAVSPSQATITPGYVSPTQQTNLAVQVQDSAGLGVGGQVVLITTDKGSLVAGFNAVTCGSSKAVTATSAAVGSPQALTLGGTAVVGGISLTYCGNDDDPAGQATITAQNISTSMANVTTTISTAGRPATVEATYANGVISAKVTDAGGNIVADGTVVQFTISSNAGAVSNACTTTTNGSASSAVSLNTGSGSVIVTAGYNESGTTAGGCAVVAAVTPTGNAGVAAVIGTTSGSAQSVSFVVNIGSVVTPPSTGGGTGVGGFAAAPVFSASKLAQAVFNGGTVAQLEAAVTAGGGTGVWAQDAQGNFNLYIVNGGFVNEGFTAAFPRDFSGVTAVTVVGQ